MKTILINNIEYKIKLGFGAMMEFEQAFNKPISGIKNTKELMSLIFICLIYYNPNFPYDFTQFIDNVIDEKPSLVSELVSIIFPNSDNEEVKKKIQNFEQLNTLE